MFTPSLMTAQNHKTYLKIELIIIDINSHGNGKKRGGGSLKP
jgi:hypothetical protein